MLIKLILKDETSWRFPCFTFTIKTTYRIILQFELLAVPPFIMKFIIWVITYIQVMDITSLEVITISMVTKSLEAIIIVHPTIVKLVVTIML